jgi:hypothetical protein
MFDRRIYGAISPFLYRYRNAVRRVASPFD